MNHFHEWEEEKGMVVILPEDRYTDWLSAKAIESQDFMSEFQADLMICEPHESPPNISNQKDSTPQGIPVSLPTLTYRLDEL